MDLNGPEWTLMDLNGPHGHYMDLELDNFVCGVEVGVFPDPYLHQNQDPWVKNGEKLLNTTLNKYISFNVKLIMKPDIYV